MTIFNLPYYHRDMDQHSKYSRNIELNYIQMLSDWPNDNKTKQKYFYLTTEKKTRESI